MLSPSISSELVNYVDGPGLLGVCVVRHATKMTKFSPNVLPTNPDNRESNQEALSMNDKMTSMRATNSSLRLLNQPCCHLSETLLALGPLSDGNT